MWLASGTEVSRVSLDVTSGAEVSRVSLDVTSGSEVSRVGLVWPQEPRCLE